MFAAMIEVQHLATKQLNSCACAKFQFWLMCTLQLDVPCEKYGCIECVGNHLLFTMHPHISTL